jgi:hypothetical protein
MHVDTDPAIVHCPRATAGIEALAGTDGDEKRVGRRGAAGVVL